MKNFNVFLNCWFAGVVTVATLVDKNKRVSLRCKLNSFLHKWCIEKLCCFSTNIAAFSQGCKNVTFCGSEGGGGEWIVEHLVTVPMGPTVQGTPEG